MPVNIKAELVLKQQLKPNIFKFSLKASEITKIARPGNFIEIRVIDNTEPFLRRPISIYNIKKEDEILEFIFQVKGKGTKILSEKQKGDLIDIIGPLGFGTFKYDKFNNIAIIGGGIGIFPLYELAKCANKDEKNVNIYLGFRNKNLVLLEKEFKYVCNNLTITTDDGSYSKQGLAVNFLKNDIEKGEIDCIYACGPLQMLKAVQKLSIEKNIPCQISLEEKMGCGLGVCLGCAVKITKSTKDNPKYFHVCKAGPVFEAKDVEI